MDGGYVEIVISGVHVGDYGLDLPAGRLSLPELLRRILDTPGLERLRLSSIEPASVTEELIALMAGEAKFARHFHIPLQSGSDAVLTRMRRRYRADHFRALIQGIVEAIPECGIGTDVICGFPGESDADFQRTFDLLEQLPVSYLHPFTYSVRPGSVAESYGDQVSGDIKKRRMQSLKRLFREKSRSFRERHVGRVMPVVVESSRSKGAARLCGWTDNYLKVNLGPGEPGAADGARARDGIERAGRARRPAPRHGGAVLAAKSHRFPAADANLLVLAGRTPSSRFDVVSATVLARGGASHPCACVAGTKRHRRFGFRLALQHRSRVRATRYHGILTPLRRKPVRHCGQILLRSGAIPGSMVEGPSRRLSFR